MLSGPCFGKDCKDIEAEHGCRGALPFVEFVHFDANIDANKQII